MIGGGHNFHYAACGSCCQAQLLCGDGQHFVDRTRVADAAGHAINSVFALGIALGLIKQSSAFQGQGYLFRYGFDELQVFLAQGARGIIVHPQRADSFTAHGQGCDGDCPLLRS